MLQKEQGMAFARAVAAGFDIDHMAPLMSFAESFGAFRLRCVEFSNRQLSSMQLYIFMGDHMLILVGCFLLGQNYHSLRCQFSINETHGRIICAHVNSLLIKFLFSLQGCLCKIY